MIILLDPNRMALHPNAAADFLTKVLPPFFVPLIAIFRNWTYALFYMLANLWVNLICLSYLVLFHSNICYCILINDENVTYE
jgi:ATP/ADP translocase